MDKQLVFTGATKNDNWFYKKYYYGGANARYLSFNLVLNILNQRIENPCIVETGCQRLAEDLGGGMSTSIFAEYIQRYGGNLISVDINQANLNLSASCVANIDTDIDAAFICEDSAKFLNEYHGPCDLLYLDSFDYPYGELLNKYGGREDIAEAEKVLWSKSSEEIITEFASVIAPCQDHCVKEFQAIEERLSEKCILLLDDNLLPGGGKPRLLKDMLPDLGWICLMDYQQSVWVKSL